VEYAAERLRKGHEPAAVTGELNHERAKLASERHAATGWPANCWFLGLAEAQI